MIVFLKKHFMKPKKLRTDIRAITTGNVLRIEGLFGAGIFPGTSICVTACPSPV